MADEHRFRIEIGFGLLALRDATLRRSLELLLHRVGRTLIPVGGSRWTSQYSDRREVLLLIRPLQVGSAISDGRVISELARQALQAA